MDRRPLAADHPEVAKTVAFQPGPEFHELARRFGLTPRRLATFLAKGFVDSAPDKLTLREGGIDLTQ
ncbi:MAG: hypothetical protein JSR82_21070 [Verrucomicrobia bacterium]|nr:hypothetical protein [Verrucomicrobiota bacterium]